MTAKGSPVFSRRPRSKSPPRTTPRASSPSLAARNGQTRSSFTASVSPGGLPKQLDLPPNCLPLPTRPPAAALVSSEVRLMIPRRGSLDPLVYFRLHPSTLALQILHICPWCLQACLPSRPPTRFGLPTRCRHPVRSTSAAGHHKSSFALRAAHRARQCFVSSLIRTVPGYSSVKWRLRILQSALAYTRHLDSYLTVLASFHSFPLAVM